MVTTVWVVNVIGWLIATRVIQSVWDKSDIEHHSKRCVKYRDNCDCMPPPLRLAISALWALAWPLVLLASLFLLFPTKATRLSEREKVIAKEAEDRKVMLELLRNTTDIKGLPLD